MKMLPILVQMLSDFLRYELYPENRDKGAVYFCPDPLYPDLPKTFPAIQTLRHADPFGLPE